MSLTSSYLVSELPEPLRLLYRSHQEHTKERWLRVRRLPVGPAYVLMLVSTLLLARLAIELWLNAVPAIVLILVLLLQMYATNRSEVDTSCITGRKLHRFLRRLPSTQIPSVILASPRLFPFVATRLSHLSPAQQEVALTLAPDTHLDLAALVVLACELS